MTHRTCTIDDCDRKHLARGMCRKHYGQTIDRSHHKMHDRTCETCGATWSTPRADARFCTAKCKGVHLSALNRRSSKLPDDHPVRMLMAEAGRERRSRRTIKPEWRTARECPGCGCSFSPLNTPNMLTCSVRCSRRVKRRRRRAREAGAYGSWVWSDFMRVARKFGYCCAYCGTKPGQLDPDHVVPLSRGGYDSTTNLLPACRPCNGDKRDLLLDEWATDRQLRGKPARMTNWAPEDKRYWHLTQAHSAMAISPAA